MQQEEDDSWKSFYQVLPESIYDRFMVQLGRLAQSNGISPGSLFDDSKFSKEHGPRVGTIENLVILLERSEDASLKV